MANDDDLIRRGDAVLAVTAADKDCLGANGAREFIRALPAVQPLSDPRVKALVEAGEPLLDIAAWTESASDGEIVILSGGTVRKLRAALAAIKEAKT